MDAMLLRDRAAGNNPRALQRKLSEVVEADHASRVLRYLSMAKKEKQNSAIFQTTPKTYAVRISIFWGF